ncbi:uncharacterized protein LY79DRAFT_566041, partial [Colletotrichum navitas]
MHVEKLVRLVAILSFSSEAVAYPNPYQTRWEEHLHKRIHVARQHAFFNTTQPHLTPASTSSVSVSATTTQTGPSSSAPAQSTISNGEIVAAVIGTTYVVGLGGAVLMVNGTPYTLAAGTVVAITGGGPNGNTPEIETVSDPDRPQEPKTSEVTSPISSSISVTSTTTSTASTTSSSAAAATPYIVLFSPNTTAEEIRAVNTMLDKEAAPNSLSEVTSDRTGLVVFFRAGINPTQANAIGQQPGVSGVFVDETLEQEQPPSSAPPSSASLQPTPTGPPGSPKSNVPNPADIRLQSDAVDELKVISQPAGANLAELPGYGYAQEGGKGVTIYVVDTGVNSQNPEWINMPGSKSFLYAPGATEEETDFLNHGSCVASKAGGPVYGTAKDANMVAVKLPRNLHISAILTVLTEISNNVFKKNLQGKAVVNLSLSTRIPDKLSSTATAYKLLLVSLMSE